MSARHARPRRAREQRLSQRHLGHHLEHGAKRNQHDQPIARLAPQCDEACGKQCVEDSLIRNYLAGLRLARARQAP